MIYRLFSTAVIAGLIAGLVVSVLQSIQVKPLILAAEVYETQARSEQAADKHSSGQERSAENGIERALYTLLANLALGIGYGLLLCSAFTLYNRAIGYKRGLLWGLAGFAAFSFIPAIGLPPEIPGMVGVALEARQSWWLSSAIASCLGLALIVFAPKVWRRIVGGMVVLVPFIVGVPHSTVTASSNLPPDLVAHYTMATLTTGIVFWGVLGGVAGYLFERARHDYANKLDYNSVKS